jgi:hypothetical protein
MSLGFNAFQRILAISLGIPFQGGKIRKTEVLRVRGSTIYELTNSTLEVKREAEKGNYPLTPFSLR